MKAEVVSVIIVVNDKRRFIPWQYNGDGALSGTVDSYHFKIGAYFLDPADGKTRKANIFCPYAIGFSAKEIPQKVFMRTSATNPRWLRTKA